MAVEIKRDVFLTVVSATDEKGTRVCSNTWAFGLTGCVHQSQQLDSDRARGIIEFRTGYYAWLQGAIDTVPVVHSGVAKLLCS